MAKIIAVANQKGGVGKTTTAVNIVAEIGAKGKRVLLIDIDPRGNASSAYGINKKETKNTIYQAIIGEIAPNQAIIKTKYKNIDIMPSDINLVGAEIELVEEKARESLLKSVVNKVKNNYDFIFIDAPPSLGLLTLNALCCCDRVLIPIQCEYFALEGLSQLINSIRQVKKIYNPDIDIEGVLFTMYDGRLNLTMQVADNVKKFFPGKVYKTTIPRNVRLSEAPSHGIPVREYDKYSKGAMAYESLCREFLEKNNN